MKNRVKKWLVWCVAVVCMFTAAIGLCVQALSTPQTAAAIGGELKILLDAGHGGIDVGVTGVATGTHEDDINLQITYTLQARLQEMGFSVVLTRRTEEGLYGTTARGFKKRDMQKRKEIIEREKPALILSIHQNYYSSQKERGGQVFYSNNHPKSKVLASLLQSNVNALYEREGVKNRKCMQGDFFILQCYETPAVILECGFLSNPQDEALLVDERWQNALAKTVAEGVISFFSEQTA